MDVVDGEEGEGKLGIFYRREKTRVRNNTQHEKGKVSWNRMEKTTNGRSNECLHWMFCHSYLPRYRMTNMWGAKANSCVHSGGIAARLHTEAPKTIRGDIFYNKQRWLIGLCYWSCGRSSSSPSCPPLALRPCWLQHTAPKTRHCCLPPPSLLPPPPRKHYVRMSLPTNNALPF